MRSIGFIFNKFQLTFDLIKFLSDIEYNFIFFFLPNNDIMIYIDLYYADEIDFKNLMLKKFPYLLFRGVVEKVEK